MQETITWIDSADSGSAAHGQKPLHTVALGMGMANGDAVAKVRKLVKDNSLIVFSSKGCCMSHVLKLLLQGLGVNPTMHEVDADDEPEVLKELPLFGHYDDGGQAANFSSPLLPTVFVRGKLFGGLEKVMSKHISGELVPILKDAGVLWL